MTAGVLFTMAVVATITLVAARVIHSDRRRDASARDGIIWVRHGLGYRLIAVLAASASVFLVGANLSVGLIHAFVLAAILGALAVPLVLIGFCWKVGYGNSGILWRSAFGTWRTSTWDDVQSADYSDPFRQWIIHTKQIGSIRINEMVPGCDGLIAELKRREIPLE